MLKNILFGFKGLPIFVQWLLLSLLKAFAGSLILAFAANYATAFFAIRHGFRVPLEGVPYLSFAVGIAGFATFLCGMLLFLPFFLLAQHTRHAIFVGRLSGPQALIFKLVVGGVLCAILVVNAGWLLDAQFAHTSLRYVLSPALPDERISYVAGGLLAATFFCLTAMWADGSGLGWIGAQLQAWLVVLVVMLSALFWYDCYGSFLRLIRYGGGVEVTVRKSDASSPAEYRSKLLWMTESHVVLFDSATNIVEEIPRSHIAAIVYTLTPAWYLPERVLDRQMLYIRIETRTAP